METLIASNMSVETKMNMRTDLQHTWVNDHEGYAISARRLRDRLPRLHKEQSKMLGDLLTAGTIQCTVQS